MPAVFQSKFSYALKWGYYRAKNSDIFADPLCCEIENRRQGPKTVGYRRQPTAISNRAVTTYSCYIFNVDSEEVGQLICDYHVNISTNEIALFTYRLRE